MIANYISINPWILIVIGIFYWIYGHKLNKNPRFIQEVKYVSLLFMGMAYFFTGVLGYNTGGTEHMLMILEYTGIEVHIAVFALSLVFLIKKYTSKFIVYKKNISYVAIKNNRGYLR